MKHDTAFQVAASNIRVGSGVTREVGSDLRDLGAERTMLVIDPALARTEVGETVTASLRRSGVGFELFDAVSV
ncbi:MAG TPA: iron-containing alcohol dehydrogenase, partial [Longimicrobiales bacterium]|nr:iron-containing alcohol dehydrogenase [Longimicrobiales bacterium]